MNGIANLVERDVVNFQRGSSQRRLTSTRRAIVPKGKDRLEDMFGRDVRMESIASFIRQSLRIGPWSRHFQWGPACLESAKGRHSLTMTPP